ncbi:MAG: ParB/RepB/Spo0J family partition protein [Spirochaetaceae bacterium]|nr:ParB/RepB/Spo0J family partition protein [Spirochaetaceae bacterium]
MAKRVLGKGLGALLSEDEPDSSHQQYESPSVDTKTTGELLVDITLLKPNPQQPRYEFDPDALQELAESIREHGIIQPVLAEQIDDGTYYIIAGERRTRAARIAGLTHIPVLLKRYSDERKLEIALIENIQRENLSPVEEARAYKRLMEMSSLTQEEAAARVGKNRSTVANALRLLKLPEDMLSAISSGQITAGHARALLSVENSADQRVLFGRILGSGMSVREAERNASELNNGSRAASASKKKASSQPRKDTQFASIEQELIDFLGTKAIIKGSLERGTIQIEYYSRDDLDRLYAILTGSA